MEDMKALFIVVNSGFAEEITDIAREQGARGATILHARGVGLNVEKILGITVDTDREMILSLVEAPIAEKVMAAVKEKADVKSPAHGICFMMPVEAMTGMQ